MISCKTDGVTGPLSSNSGPSTHLGAPLDDGVVLGHSSAVIASIAIVTQPAGAESGRALTTQPVVEVRDGSGHRVADSDIDVTAAIGSGSGTLLGVTTIRTSGGVGSFADLGVSGSGPVVISFSSPGLGIVASVAFPVAAPMLSANPGAVTFNRVIGDGVPHLVASVQIGSSGASIGGLVLGAITYSAGASAWLNANLSATATPATLSLYTSPAALAAGTYTATVTVTGADGAASTSAIVTFVVSGAAQASQLAISAQPAAATESGIPFAAQPVIEVRDGTNTKVAGATNAVTVAIASGTGSLSGTTTVNAVDGIATFTNLTISGSGVHTLAFTSPGVASATSGSVSVTQLVRELVISTQPGGAVSGVSFTGQPVIALRDAAGLAMNSATNAVTASIASGSGALSGTTTVNAVGGIATFANLTITGTGVHTLSFSTAGAGSTTSASFTVLAAPPPPPPPTGTQLLVVTQPAGVESGLAFTTQPSVEVRDGANSRVNTSELVTAALTSGAGVLSGTTTVAANHGVAQFTNLVIAGSGAVVITFTSPASSSVSSMSFTVTQVVRQLVITTQPSGAVSGVSFTGQPVIALRDAAGLAVSAATNAVTAAVASGPGVLSGTTTVNAIGGIATFSNLTITGAGAHTLGFSSAGAGSATSASFTVAAPPPPPPPPTGTQLVVVTQPAGAESGVSFATQPVIEVRDGANTRVNTAELVTATITSGAGTLTGTTTVAANHGVAQFTNLVIAGSGAFVITFTSPASSSGSSVSFAVTQVVRQLVISTQPGGAVSGANLAPQPTVSLRDQAGLAVSTATNAVTATVASGPGVLGGTTTVNAVGGVASFATLKITGAGTHTLIFGSAGAPSATSTSFAIVAVAATQLVVVTQPAAATESGVAFPTQPVVEIQDATNTKVVGATNLVTATLASGSGTLSGTTSVSAVNGTAIFANLMIAGSGPHTLSFTATSLGAATSGTITVTQVVRQLVITSQPGGAVSGVNFATQPALSLRDQAGLVVAGATTAVTASVASGGGVLSGTTTVNGSGGVATFGNLRITGTGSHTLSFGAAGAGSSTSASFTVSAPPPTQLAITTQPSGAASGVAFTTQPVVQIRDAGNALVPSATNLVTVAIASGTGTLSGTTSVNAVNGVATFTNLVIAGAGAHTLTFTATGLTSVTSSAFTVAAGGPAFQLAVNGAPTASVATGAQISIPVSLNITNGSSVNGSNVGALQFNITWDPTKFTFVSGSLGGSCAASTRNEGTAASGVVSINGFCSTGVTTSQALYTITLAAIGASGTTPSVGGVVTVAADDAGNNITVTNRGVAVTITP